MFSLHDQPPNEARAAAILSPQPALAPAVANGPAAVLPWRHTCIRRPAPVLAPKTCRSQTAPAEVWQTGALPTTPPPAASTRSQGLCTCGVHQSLAADPAGIRSVPLSVWREKRDAIHWASIVAALVSHGHSASASGSRASVHSFDAVWRELQQRRGGCTRVELRRRRSSVNGDGGGAQSVGRPRGRT
jgi:hypothetical protein